MKQAEYVTNFAGVLDHLRQRAEEAIFGDADDVTALRFAQEYCAISELISHYGTVLIALDDIEDGDLPPPSSEGAGMN